MVSVVLFSLQAAAWVVPVSPARRAASAATAHGPTPRRGRALRMDQELAGTEAFVEAELGGAWERTGKTTARWKPGDDTGDSALDARLLWSQWVLEPPVLHVMEACPKCATAQLVLGHLGFPFETVAVATGAAHPMLEGSGVPPHTDQSGLVGAMPIASFAAALSKSGKIGTATGRPDVSSWLERSAASLLEGKPATALLEELEGMLRGSVVADSAPCLNAWGFTLDDALVLAQLRCMLQSAGARAACPAKARAFLEMSCERCGLSLLQ